MANRYIIKGAAYNGDGTTTDLATSNGGVGAWNDIAYFEGTTPAYGTLPAGTTLFIRSKDASGADIVLSRSAALNFGAANGVATETMPITWVLDEGVVWPSVSGSVTYNVSGTNQIHFSDFNNFIVGKGKFTIKGIDPNFGPPVYLREGYTKNIKVDLSNITYGQSGIRPFGGTHENFHFICGSTNGACIGSAADADSRRNVTFINPQVELFRSVPGPVFKPTFYFKGGEVTIYGGRIYGTYATDGVPVCGLDEWGGKVNIIGLRYPRSMKLAVTDATKLLNVFFSIGADGNNSSEFVGPNYSYSTRLDNYYPTLNAFLDTGEPWAYSLYPFAASRQKPATIATVKKYNGAPGSKNITVNFLWPQSVTMERAIPEKSDVYMIVQYLSSAGEVCCESTINMLGGNVSESSAAWTTLTYGSTLFKKYELVLATQNPIATNSNLVVTFQCAIKAGALADILIVDPDPVVS